MFLGLLKTTNRGRECLIFNCPESPSSCFVFIKMKDSSDRSVASCVRCRDIYSSLPKDEETEPRKPATIQVVNGFCFDSDPSLATHLPGCEPSSFQTAIEKFDSGSDEWDSSISDQDENSYETIDKYEDFSSVSSENKNNPAATGEPAGDYSVDMCMSIRTPKNPIFLYKFSDDQGNVKCYRFLSKNGMYRCPNMDFITNCSGCITACEKSKTTGVTLNKTSKRSDGHKMLSNPHDNHVPGCDPFDYADVIKKYRLVTDEVKEKIIKGEVIGKKFSQPDTPLPQSDSPTYAYPVEMCMNATNPRNPFFIFKFTDDNDNSCKAYKFNVSHSQFRCINKNFLTICTGCQSIYRGMDKTKGAVQRNLVRTNGTGMMSDPRANHLPGCVPFNYDDVIKRYPAVTDEVREKIINGEDIRKQHSPIGSVFSVNPILEDYPVSIAMNGRTPINPMFIYRLKNKPDKCYRFLCQNPYGSAAFSLFCAGCERSYIVERRRSGKSQMRITRKSDGRSMISDPHSGHLPGCEPYDYKECLKKNPLVKDIVAQKIIEGKDISTHLPPKGSPFPIDGCSEERCEDKDVPSSSVFLVQSDEIAPPVNCSSKARNIMKRKISVDSVSDNYLDISSRN